MKKLFTLFLMSICTCVSWAADTYTITQQESFDVKFFFTKEGGGSDNAFSAGEKVTITSTQYGAWPTLTYLGDKVVELTGGYAGSISFIMPAANVDVTDVTNMITIDCNENTSVIPGQGCLTNEATGYALPGATIRFVYKTYAEYEGETAYADVKVSAGEVPVFNQLTSTTYDSEENGYVFEYTVPTNAKSISIENAEVRLQIRLADDFPSSINHEELFYDGVYSVEYSVEGLDIGFTGSADGYICARDLNDNPINATYVSSQEGYVALLHISKSCVISFVPADEM